MGLLLSAPHPALADSGRPDSFRADSARAESARADFAHADSARTLCTIRDRRITESSGLAASADRLWTINDGGSSLRVFELDRSCRVLRTIQAGIDPHDVEDLARAADGTFWLADTGDNALNRSTVALERLRPDGSATLFRLTYPDGPHDAEAILLTPSGQLFIATKEPLASNVYTPDGPLSTTRPTPLRQVASIGFLPTGTAGGRVGAAGQVLVTGGAVAPDGRTVVLRTYTDAYVWSAPDGDVAAAIKSGQRRRIALPPTAQGEAVTFSADGRSLLTSTEGVPGAVHEIPLGGPPPAPTPSATRPAAGSVVADDPGSDREAGDLLRTLLIPVVAVVALGALLSYLAARRR
jgi:sugar lactone lactonase YvrE